MSLQRLVFYSALIGGWAAFVGWMLSEMFFLQRSSDIGFVPILFTAALVGACIAGALNLLGGVASGTLRGQWQRLLPGLLGGFVGGAVGGGLGNLIYSKTEFYLFQVLGWTLMGVGIGAVEGIYDRSIKKIRNGLIGGAVGGFLGGLLFVPIFCVIGGNMSSRATSFVILGLSIGLFVGLAQVVLREAWLTVEAGFRPGRQVLLNLPITALGTSERSQLPFIAFGAKGVEPLHLRIVRTRDGRFVVEDQGSRTGTFVNGAKIDGPKMLRHDDMIQLGVNVVRFREMTRTVAKGDLVDVDLVAAPAKAASRTSAPSPPPLPKSAPPPLPRVQPPAPPAAKPASPPPVAKTPPPRPAPAAQPALVAKRSGPEKKACPICGRVGTPTAAANKFICDNCEINF